MKTIKYIVFKEGKYYVSQCLNVDISSFGKTVEEASSNLKEALDFYLLDRKEVIRNIPMAKEPSLSQLPERKFLLEP